MIQSMLKASQFNRVLAAQAAGTGDTLQGAVIDLQNCKSVLGIAVLGTVASTAKVTLKAMIGEKADLSDGVYEMVTAEVTAAGTDTNQKLLLLDIVSIRKRYCRFDLVRATANAVVDGVLAICYNERTTPAAQNVDVAAAAIIVG